MSLPEVYDVTHAVARIRSKANLRSGELRLLEHVVTQTLAGASGDLSQKTLAADAFGRDLADFDPTADSIVRTTAANLRDSLMSYYSGAGQSDAVVIELPKGTYIPRFSFRNPLSAAATSRLWSARVALEARTVSGYSIAIRHLDAVLEESPRLSIALALKAEALASKSIHGARPRPALNEAREFAARAVDQPQPVWQAWLAQGIIEQALNWNWKAAEDAYRCALHISKGESATHVWYTAFLVGRGRPKESVAHLRQNLDRFNYSNPTCIGDLSMLLMLARDYDGAEAAIEAALEAAPGYYQHHMNRAILREAQGNPAAALEALSQTPLRLHERPVTWGLRALFAGLNGEPKVARRRLAWLEAVRKTGKYVPPSQFAACWLGSGELEEAVRSLENGAEDRDPLAVWFHAYPFFRHLHQNARFKRLIEQIGLVWY